MDKKKPSNKCRTVGFVTDCSECGSAFVAAAHVGDDCGPGDHTEQREGLVCTDCIFRRNIKALS